MSVQRVLVTPGAPQPKRAETRFDKYAVQQIGREYRLKPNQRLVLFMMANIVNYQTGDWTGTLLELHDDTGISRDTLATVVANLADLGLLLELEPFTRNGQGCFRLLCLERLIVLTESAAQNLRDRFATDLSAIRGGYVGSSTYDQPKEGPVRNKATRKEKEVVSTPARERKRITNSEQDEDLSGDHVSAQGDEDQCGYPGCTEPYNDDHLFNGHEPVPPTTLSKTTELADTSDLTDEVPDLFPNTRDEHEHFTDCDEWSDDLDADGDIADASEEMLDRAPLTATSPTDDATLERLFADEPAEELDWWYASDDERIAALMRAFPGTELVSA